MVGFKKSFNNSKFILAFRHRRHVLTFIRLLKYMILLGAVLIFEIFGGVLAFIYRAKLKETLKTDLENIIHEKYKEPGYDKITASLDDLQLKVGMKYLDKCIESLLNENNL